MNRLSVLKGVLWLWVVWHLIFGLLATFAPGIGGGSVGWHAQGGWNPDLLTMSTQYGMVMVLLALVFLIAALDPRRYLDVIWVAIAEQVLGIAYAGYIYFQFGQITIPQMFLQAGINTVVAIFLLMLRLGLRDSRPALA